MQKDSLKDFAQIGSCGVVLVGIVLGLAAIEAKAQTLPIGRTLTSDWAMAMPLSTVTEMMKGSGFAIQVRGKDMDYSEDSSGQKIKASVRGLSLNAGKSISSVQFGQNGEVSVNGGLQGLTVQMKKLSFSIQVTVPLTPGGEPVSTSINGECEDVNAVFMMPIAVNMKTRYSAESMKFQLESWNWDIQNSKFAWIARTCRGPNGVSQFLKEKVFEKFVSSENAKSFVMAEADSFFNDAFGGVLGKMFSQSLIGLKMDAQVEKVRWAQDVFYIDGRADIQDTAGCSSFNLGANRSRVGLDTTQRAAIKNKQFIFPEETVLRTIQCLHEGQKLVFDGTTSDISGFSDLMKNRTNQSYVWPDLGSFPTSQVFLMKSRSYDKLTLAPASTTSGFLASLSSSLISYWSSNTGPYVTFWTPFSSTVRVNIEKDQLVMTSTSARSVKISYRFERKVSDTYIDTSQFTQPVTDFLSTLKQTWPLPSIALPGGRKMIPATLTTVPGKSWIFTMKD